MPTEQEGKLFIFSGINGAGKDTIIPFVEKSLSEKGYTVKSEYGPRISASTTALRSVLLDEKFCPKDLFSQALLWLSLHAESAAEVAKLRSQGTHVLLNRGPETSYVYNVLDRKAVLGEEAISALNEIYVNLMKRFNPTGIILLDIDVETALKRANQQHETDHFQGEKEAYTTRKAVYEELVAMNPELWHRIDARKSVIEVAESAEKAIMKMLG